MFEFRPSSRASEKDTRRKAEYMARVLGMMDYDAIALGEKDLAFGENFLREQAKLHSLPFVCANAVGPKDTPLFDPYRIVEKDGVKVAFLGVVSPERHIVAQVETELVNRKIRILDPTTVAKEHIPTLREEADVIVLLSHVGIETSEFLAEDLDVDVVVVGHYPAVANQPRKIGNSILAMAGAKSDRFGTLELTLGAEGGIDEFSGDAIRLLRKGPMVDEIQMLSDEIDTLEKEERRAKQLAAQREREKAQSQQEVSTIHHRNGVLGAESCKTCHADVYESWRATPHAEAFATLAEADAWDDPECIGCHVTGVEDKHYVADVNLAPEVWNVQCEECHGSGLLHARDGSYLASGVETCTKCHDEDNSPEFDFELYSSYGVH